MTEEAAWSQRQATTEGAGSVPRDAENRAASEQPATATPAAAPPPGAGPEPGGSAPRSPVADDVVEGAPTSQEAPSPPPSQPYTPAQGQPGTAGMPPPPGMAPPGQPGTPPSPPPPGTPPGQPGAPPPDMGPPPGYAGSAFPLRHNLVRPRHGRYLAGVCAAIGRATNTDPVLWRVLLAVLGFFGGIGILVYLAVWLATPAEGDSASPVEGLLGRGRSSTSPIVVIILGMLVALVFGLIVTDAFRAALLGVAVLIGGALLLNRNPDGRWPLAGAAGTGPAPGTMPAPGPMPAQGMSTQGPVPAQGMSTWGPTPTPTTMPASTSPVPPLAGVAPPGPFPPPAPVYPAAAYPAFPPGRPAMPSTAAVPPAGAMSAATTEQLGLPTPQPAPPGSYRPAFAPRGPYAGGGLPPSGVPRVPPVPPPPKPPKERSGLAAATFSMALVVIGVITALDLSNALHIGPSAYFAGPLVTVALGLLIGTWFGRARWLIALGLVLCVALGIATAAEKWDRNVGSDVVWAPQTADALAYRYENNFGDAVLNLSAVDFTGLDRKIVVELNFGTLEVILPPQVDVTASVEVGAGKATVLGSEWSGVNQPNTDVTDLGPDGAGGGQLDLTVRVNAGDAEVHR